MTISEVVALVAVILNAGTNVALHVHLCSTMNARFDSIERRLEMEARCWSRFICWGVLVNAGLFFWCWKIGRGIQ